MERINNYALYEKLNNFFEGKIKISYVSKLSVIIVTKYDECYEFKRNNIKNSLIALSDNISKVKSLIDESFVENLSSKNVIDFKNGVKHLIARTVDGKIYSWGENGKGMLGNGSQDWGISEPELNQYLKNEFIINMSCGREHTLVLTSDGDVYAWGGNTFGQIGNRMSGSNKCQTIPFKLNVFQGDKVKSISCGPYHSLALTENGRVYSWGRNNCGQLGIGNLIEYDIPKLVELSQTLNMQKISCGNEHNLLLSRYGDIYVCGWNRYGELGISDCEYTWLPIKLNRSEKFIDIASHFDRPISAAVSANGVHYIWGDYGDNIIEPKETDFKSFNEIFEHYFQITYEPKDSKVIQFNDDFKRIGEYEYKFDEENPIGVGSYCNVYVVREKFDKKRKYAIKKIKFTDDSEKEFMRELENSPLISQLRHENIVKYYNVWLENDFKNGIKNFILYVQMEFCDQSLNELISEIESDSNFYSKETLTSLGYFTASKIFLEILEGVNYLHKQNPPIIHRDLNSMNILLKIEKNKKSFVKIAGFSLATIHQYETERHTRDRGNIRYMAPEVEMSETYDTRADIYSLGIILQELFKIDINRDYEIENDSQPKPFLIKKYQKMSELCDKMARPRIIQRPNIESILKEKHLWALNVNEFNFEEEIQKISNSYKSNETFIFKLLKLLV